MKVLDIAYDKVINSYICLCKGDIKFVKDNLAGIINKYEEQRYTLDTKFYLRLRKDLETGCIIPPLTIAFVVDDFIDNNKNDYEAIEKYIVDNINTGFVLDGIQRINNINKIPSDNVDLDLPIYFNVIFSKTKDKLLYRMITLNNGQKPMSARHQIEMLASYMYDFDDICIEMQTEKNAKEGRKNSKAFTKEAIVKSYLAFVSKEYSIDNQKIIDSKMDELISGYIFDSNILERDKDFSMFIELIKKMSEDDYLFEWLSNNNNIIGIASAGTDALVMLNYDNESIVKNVGKIEMVFNSFDRSKIKLGSFRRKMSQYLAQHFEKIDNQDENELLQDVLKMEQD